MVILIKHMTRINRRAFHGFHQFPVSCFLFSLFSLFSLLLGFPLSNVTVISDRGKTICFEAMAPKAESVVILADVGRKLSDDAAREVLDIAQSILKNKLFYGWKTDSVSVVLFGTTTSKNALYDDMIQEGISDQYENILVLKYPTGLDASLLTTFDDDDAKLRGGKSDYLDALVVALDMLTKRSQVEKPASRKKMIIISNFMDSIKEVDEDFRGQIVQGLKNLSCEVELVTLDPFSAISAHPPVNRDLALHLESTSVASIACAGDFEDYPALREVKKVSPFASGKHNLQILGLQIPVTLYKKVTGTAMSKNFKTSNFVRDEKGEMCSVKRETEYHKVSDPDGAAIEKDARVKAYPYGKDLIPIDEATTSFLSQKEDKSLCLLGFKERESIPPWLYLGEPYVLVPETKDKNSQKVISSLVQATEDENQVAIVRLVVRAKSDPVLGALLPLKSTEEDVPDCFVLKTLPFSEDIREYQFASFRDIPSKCIPSGEELDLAKNIIESMSLIQARPGGDLEHLVPESMANPSIQNMHSYLVGKLLGKSTDGDKMKATRENSKNFEALAGPSKRLACQAKPFVAKLAKKVKLGGTANEGEEEVKTEEKVKAENEVPVEIKPEP